MSRVEERRLHAEALAAATGWGDEGGGAEVMHAEGRSPQRQGGVTMWVEERRSCTPKAARRSDRAG